MQTETERAAAHINAIRHDLGDYGVFYSYLEQTWSSVVFLVTDEDMEDLGERLRIGDSDAYSSWCADTTAEEIGVGYISDRYPSGSVEDVEATAQREHDVHALAILAHLRDDVEATR